MSIHTWKAREKAQRLGGFAGEDCAADLWELSKRELVEIALRLTMRESPAEAVDAVNTELAHLRDNGIV